MNATTAGAKRPTQYPWREPLGDCLFCGTPLQRRGRYCAKTECAAEARRAYHKRRYYSDQAFRQEKIDSATRSHRLKALEIKHKKTKKP